MKVYDHFHNLALPVYPQVKALVVFLSTQSWSEHGKVKVKFTLEQAMKAQRGSRGIALLFL
jgi:hypothetical protein